MIEDSLIPTLALLGILSITFGVGLLGGLAPALVVFGFCVLLTALAIS
jgi:hypothetical protein